MLESVQFWVVIGGRYLTVSGAGLTCKLPFLHARWVPVSTIGTIGRPVCRAKWTKPYTENQGIMIHRLVSIEKTNIFLTCFFDGTFDPYKCNWENKLEYICKEETEGGKLLFWKVEVVHF